jgi:hypothetical protein
MVSRIRGRVSYASVAATLALVFAMSGGAYAAGRFVITSTKQIKPSVLKQLKGANGKPGAAGPAGPAGPAGAVGAAGKAGAEGHEGKEGKEGVEGKEGKAGAEGKAGSPWPGGGVLPGKATETGVIAGPSPTEETAGRVYVPISFPVRLENELEASQVEVVQVGATGTACKGSAAEPTAPEEFLCVYLEREPAGDVASATILNPGKESGVGAARTGALLSVVLEGHAEAKFYGTWAVTG